MIESDNSLDIIAATKEIQEKHIEYKRKQIKTLLHFYIEKLIFSLKHLKNLAKIQTINLLK